MVAWRRSSEQHAQKRRHDIKGAAPLLRHDDVLELHLLPFRAERLPRILVIPYVVRLAVWGLDVQTGAERPVAGSRITTAFTDSSNLTMRQASAISSHMIRLNALSESGRFSVMVAT